VYWRLTRPVPLTALDVPLLADRALADFLDRAAGDCRLPLAALVFSAGFSVADGSLCDAKIDLCAHCVARPAAAWAEVVDRCCRQHGLERPLLAGGLPASICEVALVGLGVPARGHPRLNVYLKTPGIPS
jgi:hypothetical protein